MEKQSGQILLDRWVEDESFHTKMPSDPIGVASSTGIELSDEDQELEQILEKYRLGC
jgi:hypothetical protein